MEPSKSILVAIVSPILPKDTFVTTNTKWLSVVSKVVESTNSTSQIKLIQDQIKSWWHTVTKKKPCSPEWNSKSLHQVAVLLKLLTWRNLMVLLAMFLFLTMTTEISHVAHPIQEMLFAELTPCLISTLARKNHITGKDTSIFFNELDPRIPGSNGLWIPESLLSGHTVKFANYQNPVPMPYDATPYANSQLHFKTGGSITAATDGELMIYYAKNCNSNICTYTKELSVVLSSRSKSYDFYLPDFDYNKDQLIMDFRSDDAVSSLSSSLAPRRITLQLNYFRLNLTKWASLHAMATLVVWLTIFCLSVLHQSTRPLSIMTVLIDHAVDHMDHTDACGKLSMTSKTRNFIWTDLSSRDNRFEIVGPHLVFLTFFYFIKWNKWT